MIERKHRVLALSRRGLDIQTIADTLCLPHGEVELILALASKESRVPSPGSEVPKRSGVWRPESGVFPAIRERQVFSAENMQKY